MRRLRKPLACLGAVAALAVVLALGGLEAASGESVQQGVLRLEFDGGFSPQVLPRDRLAPVSVDFRGSIATTDGSPRPRLQRIVIAVNRYGSISTRGLPVCEARQLESTSSATALSRCRGALVGHGVFEAGVEFPNAPPFPVEGRMLAFNGRAAGRPAILMHIYGQKPIQATVVLVFKITHPGKGRFGTVLSTRIPKIASDAGYITGVSFSFDRRYRFHGEPRSFLSARCAAPNGFFTAPFSFARGSFAFSNGQTVPVTLVRDCRVRS